MVEPKDNELWLKLRSDVYIRDKGICWICNDFVELKDYDLGHLIDRCNGGKDAYDNLAVMHHECNISKPRHMSLEEAMKWKLTPSYLDRPRPKDLPLAISNPNIPTPHLSPRLPQRHIFQRLEYYNDEDKRAIKELIIEYFNNRPELLANGDGYNKDRIIASKQIATTLNLTIADVRACLIEAGLVKMRPPQITDGSQYHYVYEHLDELLAKYETIKHEFLYDHPKLMGIPAFYIDIMLYLSGQFHKVGKCNYANIHRRVAQLKIPVRSSYLENIG